MTTSKKPAARQPETLPGPASEKLEALRAALEAYAAGEGPGGLFDAQAEEAKAPVRKRALRLLEQRARSRHELRDRLLRAECDPDVAEVVCDDLERAGLLDDAAFAAEWVRQRHKARGKSARALDRELRDKGVSSSARAQALEQVTASSEEDIALELARKKARSIKSTPADYAERMKQLRRIVGVVARRGFDQGLCMSVATRALEERQAELED